MVSEKEDQRSTAQARRLQSVEQAAHIAVQRFHHRQIGPPGLVGLAPVAGEQVLRGLERRLWRVVGELQEERIVVFAFHELDRLVSEKVGEVLAVEGPVVPVLVQRYKVLVGQRVGVRAPVVVACTHEAEERVKAALLRNKVFIRAQVPLADQSRAIAGIPKVLREDLLLARQRLLPISPLKRQVLLEAEPRRMSAGEERRSRGT